MYEIIGDYRKTTAYTIGYSFGWRDAKLGITINAFTSPIFQQGYADGQREYKETAHEVQ